MSRRAELLRLCLAYVKKRQKPAAVPMAQVRLRLKSVERFVPHPPRGTQTNALDAAGVAAVRIVTRQSREDRCVLYFHGGAYAIGTAKLYRDLTWRVAAAARATVLFFDYRLAPEHPFPAALEDAVTTYRWLAKRIDPRRIAFMGDSAGGGLALATLHKLRDDGDPLPAAAVAVSPWTDLALTGASLQANAAADPMLHAALLPALANDHLAGAGPLAELSVHRCICIICCIGIRLSFRWAMIHNDPAITSATISTPKASASTLLVLSGAVVICRKKTRCTPICAMASTTSATGIPGPQISDVSSTANEAAVNAEASTKLIT